MQFNSYHHFQRRLPIKLRVNGLCEIWIWLWCGLGEFGTHKFEATKIGDWEIVKVWHVWECPWISEVRDTTTHDGNVGVVKGKAGVPAVEVGDLEVVSDIEEEVLRLEVAVGNIAAVT